MHGIAALQNSTIDEDLRIVQLVMCWIVWQRLTAILRSPILGTWSETTKNPQDFAQKFCNVQFGSSDFRSCWSPFIALWKWLRGFRWGDGLHGRATLSNEVWRRVSDIFRLIQPKTIGCHGNVSLVGNAPVSTEVVGIRRSWKLKINRPIIGYVNLISGWSNPSPCCWCSLHSVLVND